MNVCGSAHCCGCVVNGSVAMAAFLVLPNSLYYSLSNLVEWVRLRSSSIASTNTESTDTKFSLPIAVHRAAFIYMYQRIWTPLVGLSLLGEHKFEHNQLVRASNIMGA